MKDVVAGETFRGGGKQPLIRKYPNGETHVGEANVPITEYIGYVGGTWGSETSQYPEEKRITKADFLFRVVSKEIYRNKVSA